MSKIVVITLLNWFRDVARTEFQQIKNYKRVRRRVGIDYKPML